MDSIATIPIWALALVIFLSRILDVSLGTMRTISVVNGRITISVVLGFFEVLIWVAAVSQVITRLPESPLLLLSYAGGFAAGNAVGILLEQKVALGRCIVRLISIDKSREVTRRLRDLGQVLTTFEGEGRDGPRTMIYATCERRNLRTLIRQALEVDPRLFYAVERVSQTSHLHALPHPTGWRAVFKRK